MSHSTSSRPRRTGVLCVALAAAAGALTTFSAAPAGAVVGDPAADGAYPYTVKLTVGDNLRACTGALVDPSWVITAASCFSDDPAQPQALQAGAPKWKTAATVAGKALDVLELAPRTDRDLVMARLAAPVNGVTPLAVSATAPAADEKLRVPGYGRTKDEWVPAAVHSGLFHLDAVQPTTIAVTGQNGAAICKGDTGAPAVRETNGKAELAAVASRSWQGGCLGTPTTETRTGALSSRVDDLGQWITKVRHSTPSGTTVSASPFTVADPATGHLITFVQDSNNHLWSVDPAGEGWRDLGAKAATRPTALVDPANQHVAVYVNGPNNLLHSLDYTTGIWTPFPRTPAATALAADAVPRTVVDPANGHLVTFVRDTDNHLWSVDPAGEGWHDFGALAAGDPFPVVNPNDGHIAVYVNGPDNRLHRLDRNSGRADAFTPTTSGTVMAPGSTPVTVVDPANGHFTTFIRDTDNHLWSVDPLAAGWRDWGAKAATDPTALVDPANNHVAVYVNGPNNLLHSLDYTTGTWTPWAATPAGTVLAPDTIPQTIADPATRHLITFVRDTNNTLWSVDPAGPGYTRYHGGPSAP